MSMAKRNGIELRPHENGPWSLENGMFINAYVSDACTNDPAVYIDMEDGTLLKSGDASMVKDYAGLHTSELLRNGFSDMAKGLTVIEFDRYPSAKLTADEICTLMNYLQNSLGAEKVQALFQMEEEKLKEKLKALYEIGF